MIQDFPCTHLGCSRTFKRQSNRTHHYNTEHRPLSPDSEPDPALRFRVKYHPKLNGALLVFSKEEQPLTISIALPCDIQGNFISEYSKPPPPDCPDKAQNNPWHPFEDHLAFDWAHYHFVELQSSERKINKGLDLWLATILKLGNDTPPPWSSAQEMYNTIDAIQEGDAPFMTIHIKYSGPIGHNPPRWMTERYELCTRDSKVLLKHQLATTDFDGAFDTKPYRQFDYKNDRVWSNLMSADWAWSEAVWSCLDFYDNLSD